MKVRVFVFLALLPAAMVLPISLASVSAKNKFLGNIFGSASEPTNFSEYWNQVTPENAGKWGEVEKSKDGPPVWSTLDSIYNYAKNRGFPFKYHTLIWGTDQPSWVTSKAEVEDWIKAVGQRYPYMDFVDVVNEPLHDPPPYKNVIDGDGSTGWDWVIWAFQTARKYCSGKLLINEWGCEGDWDYATERLISIINLLKARGLIDGIGLQGHGLESVSADTIKSNLDKLAATGLPIYVSEYDVIEADDNRQLDIYKAQFPVFWEHPDVQGVTLWGYIQGQTWKPNTYLLRSDSTERPALTWLMQYVKGMIRLSVERGLAWLSRSDQQNTDGSWSYDGTENVGITSLCALAFLNQGILNDKITKALDWIVSKRTNYGAISTPATGGREENAVYDTSMAILALVAGETLGYTLPFGPNLKTVISNAATYLIYSQCVGPANDGYNYPPTDLNYGGWGYPSYHWADLSNTQFAVLALAAVSIANICSVPASVWENAALFTIRCLEDSRYNPYWAGANDYGFEYRPWGIWGSAYESMSGAGVWCLGLCRAHVSSVTVDGVPVPLDSAISDGVRWLQAHASVDENYGRGNYFYYYTLMSVAKGYVIVNQGLVWYAQMAAKLIFSQAPDGHWASAYWEEPDTMATVEAILALETRMAPPSTISPELHVILGSYANLYITDPVGRHLGIDPNTGQVINEIPDATFSVNLEETASIPYPLNGTYVVSVVGTGAGPYNLTVEGEINGTMTSLVSFLGNASRGVTQEWSATVAEVFGPFTVITTPRIHVGLAGDVNGDDKVDLKDVFLVYKAFGSSQGSLNWNLLADLNEDGKVDLKDVFIVSKNFGKHT